MVSGRQTLGSIERTLNDLRGEESRLTRRVEQSMRELNDMRAQELEAYRELARFRLRDGSDRAFGQRIYADPIRLGIRLGFVIGSCNYEPV